MLFRSELQEKLKAAEGICLSTCSPRSPERLTSNLLFSCAKGLASAREGWIQSDAANAQLEKIRREHADGLELVQKENSLKLEEIAKERDDDVKAFAALERSSADEAKQLRIERANAISTIEPLQQRINEATVRTPSPPEFKPQV